MKILLSLPLLKCFSGALVPACGRFLQNSHFSQIILGWIGNETDLRLVSQDFKEGYDSSRYWLLPPDVQKLIPRPLICSLNSPFPLLKPEISLDIVLRQVSPSAPTDFESFKQTVNVYLLSLPVEAEGDRQYWKIFKLLKFGLQPVKRVADSFEFDLKRLARIIAARPFKEAECFQLFISEDAAVSKTINPASGRNAFQEALAQRNLDLARWILKYLPFDGLVSHLDLRRWNGLHYACAFGDLQLVKETYMRNPKCLKGYDSKYQLPIAQAIKRDHDRIFKFLRSMKSPLNGASHRENSAFLAIQNHGIKSLQIILQDAEFNPSQLSRSRQTIWQAALLSGNPEVVKVVFQSRHCQLSAAEIREILTWTQHHATEQVFEFIEDYYQDFVIKPFTNE